MSVLTKATSMIRVKQVYNPRNELYRLQNQIQNDDNESNSSKQHVPIVRLTNPLFTIKSNKRKLANTEKSSDLSDETGNLNSILFL